MGRTTPQKSLCTTSNDLVYIDMCHSQSHINQRNSAQELVGMVSKFIFEYHYIYHVLLHDRDMIYQYKYIWDKKYLYYIIY